MKMIQQFEVGDVGTVAHIGSDGETFTVEKVYYDDPGLELYVVNQGRTRFAWISADRFTLAAPVLSEDDKEVLGIGPDAQDGYRRQMALHHAVELAKATDCSDYDSVVAAAKAFEAFLRG